MKRIVLPLLLALGSIGSASAFRVLDQVEAPYELSLAAVQLPADARGAVSFKTCDSCRTVTHRVSTSTRYFLNRAEVTLEGLNLAATNIRRSGESADRTLVAVFIDIESHRVTRIAIQQPNRR
jgi:hypothetical protein